LRSAPDDDRRFDAEFTLGDLDEQSIDPQLTQEFVRSGRRQSPLASDNPNISQLTPEEEKIVSTWCEESHTADYHIQLVEIAQQLRATDRPTAFRRIGDIFGISGSSVQTHLSGGRWTRGMAGRPPALGEIENGFICRELFERWCLEAFPGA
jgi:DNA-binding CsgD family transcriptional regulator